MPRSLGAAAANEENNMLQEFVSKILSLAEPTFREEAGRLYSSRPLNAIEPPLITPIQVQTLAGFRDLAKLHDSSDDPCFVLIEDYREVKLVASQPDEWSRRAVWVRATLPGDSPRFAFGQWQDPEQFIIGMMTLFEDADYAHSDHRKIVKLINSLTAEAVTVSTDDGVSQQVTTRQGIVNKAEEKVSPRVNLSPFRTFREVSQPMSEFILRLRSRQGQMPSCALFEADGGEWKNSAIRNIHDYFAKEMPGADIVA
jgi:hypothetical protein